jgi:hypothetical protein
MPAFAAGENIEQHRLNAQELGLIVDWLRGKWFEPASEAAHNPAAE